MKKIGFGTKTFKQWASLPLLLIERLRKEPEKYRSMIVPINLVDDLGVHEYIFYCVVPNQEFQDIFLEVQSRYPDEEKTKRAQEMFKDVLAGIKSTLDNLKDEWKKLYLV